MDPQVSFLHYFQSFCLRNKKQYVRKERVCWDISTFQLWAIFPFQAVTGLDAKPAESTRANQPIHTAPKRYIVTMGKMKEKLPYASNARWAIPSGKKKQVRLAGLKLRTSRVRERDASLTKGSYPSSVPQQVPLQMFHTHVSYTLVSIVCLLFSTRWAISSKSISLHADHFRK